MVDPRDIGEEDGCRDPDIPHADDTDGPDGAAFLDEFCEMILVVLWVLVCHGPLLWLLLFDSTVSLILCQMH